MQPAKYNHDNNLDASTMLARKTTYHTPIQTQSPIRSKRIGEKVKSQNL